MTQIIEARVKNIVQTEAEWLLANPIILQGEVAYVKFGTLVNTKVGDGILRFSELSYNLQVPAAFRGVAMKTLNPGIPTTPEFYFAGESGVFPNFSGITVDATTGINILVGSSGSYIKLIIPINLGDVLTKTEAQAKYLQAGSSKRLNFKSYAPVSYVGFPNTNGTFSLDANNLLTATSTDQAKFFVTLSSVDLNSADLTGISKYIVVGKTAAASLILCVEAGTLLNKLFSINSAGNYTDLTSNPFISGTPTGIVSTSKVKMNFLSDKVQILVSTDAGLTYNLYGEINKAAFGIVGNRTGTLDTSSVKQPVTILTVVDDGSSKDEINTSSIIEETNIDDTDKVAIISKKSPGGIKTYPAAGLINKNAISFVQDVVAAYPLLNNPGSNFTATYDPTTRLLKVRPVVTGSNAVYGAAINDIEISEAIISWSGAVTVSKTYVVIGADATRAYFADITAAASKVYRVNVDGSISVVSTVTSPLAAAINGTKLKIKHTATTVEIYDYINGAYVLWNTYNKATVGITKSVSGAASNAASSFFDVYISVTRKNTGTNVNIDSDTVPPLPLFNAADDFLLALSKETDSQTKKITLAYLATLLGITGRKWTGKVIYLYGDSISSTDYPWYKEYLEAKTGATVILGGKSGWTAAQLTSTSVLNAITALKPDLVIFMPAGNDSGEAGTVGTFTPGNPNAETVVLEPDTTAAYAGTKYIEALAYIVKYISKGIYDFRTSTAAYNAVTTNPFLALKKPKMIILGGLPQQRGDRSLTGIYNNPLNHKRKSDAAQEIAHRYHLPFLDTLKLCGFDLSIEPFYTGPTDQINSNGVYMMDGVHPNRYGYDRLTDVVVNFISGI
jgi:lysophospholipase L1-like esterase